MNRILLIDDDRSTLKLMSKMISTLGYDCTSVQDPREGLYRLDSEKFDVLITDLVMPELDGIKVLKEVKLLQHLQQKIQGKQFLQNQL